MEWRSGRNFWFGRLREWIDVGAARGYRLFGNKFWDYFSKRRNDLRARRRKPLSIFNLPDFMHDVGSGDPAATGLEFLRHFEKIGGLKRDYRVLDVGCGIGRMAIPLLFFLDERGSYEGFDISSHAISWCQDHITRLNPVFRFRYENVHNKRYNPLGRLSASDCVFPYDDHSFNFVFLTSVFTHMLPQDMENYVNEISRVLKRGARCFSTFFLLNDGSLELMRMKQSDLDFCYDFGLFRATSDRVPEAVVAYPEPHVREVYHRHGLAIIDPVYCGSWSGRADSLSYQDIIVATRV